MTKDAQLALRDRIRECAALAGSGDELSRKAGLARRTLENYLSGKSEPKALTVLRIADAVGVSVDWLVSGRSPKMRVAEIERPVSDRIVRDRAEAIYGEILLVINAFLATHQWTLSPRRMHQVAEEFLDYVIRYDEPDTRAAILEVLSEAQIPAIYREQSGDQPPTSATPPAASGPHPRSRLSDT